MPNRWRLPQFQNVVATGTAVLPNIPTGDTFDQIRLALGGTAFTKAMITALRLKLMGKTILNATGSHVDKMNQYLKETANAGYLTLNFAEREARNVGQDDVFLGSIDTSNVPTNQFSMEVDIAGATAPTLTGYAKTRSPQAGATKALFKAMTKMTAAPAAAGEFSLVLPTGSVQGNLIKRVHLFHSNITQVDVKLDGVDLIDNGLVGLMQFEQNELTRTTQAGHLCVDFLVDNDQRETVSTVRKDGTPANLDFRYTVSAADTVVVYTEMYSTIDRL